MTLRKSKAIKKVKLDMQQQALKHAPTTQLKVGLKLAQHKSQALKSVNAKVKKCAHITAKKLHIDQDKVTQAFDSLVKYYRTNNDGDDKLYLVAELTLSPNNDQATLIQVYGIFNHSPLKTPIHRKVGFVVHGDLLPEFEKKFPQHKVISQNAYLSHDADDRKLITSLDLILIDYTLYSKLQSKKTCKKAFPFHPQKVPFEVKKHYQITDYDQYINFLKSSTFAHLKNQIKQYIPIARIHDSRSDLTQIMIDFCAKILAQTKSNSIQHLYLKTNKSIELLIY